MNKDISTIVFDLDGTLINSAPDLCYALNTTLKEINIPEVPLKEVMGYLGDGAIELIKRGISKTNSIENFNTEDLRIRFLEIYNECLLDKTTFYPHVIDSIKTLKKNNFSIAICTNKPEKMAKTIINGLGANKLFDAITGGDTYKYRKPDPRHLINTILKTGNSVNKAIMIGDSKNDIDCAKKANIKNIVVNFGYSKIPVKKLQADHILHDYLDLIDKIKEIKKTQS